MIEVKEYGNRTRILFENPFKRRKGWTTTGMNFGMKKELNKEGLLK